MGALEERQIQPRELKRGPQWKSHSGGNGGPCEGHNLPMASGFGGEQNKPAGEDQIERVGKVVEQKDAMADGRGRRRGRPRERTAPALEGRFG